MLSRSGNSAIRESLGVGRYAGGQRQVYMQKEAAQSALGPPRIKQIYGYAPGLGVGTAPGVGVVPLGDVPLGDVVLGDVPLGLVPGVVSPGVVV